MAPQPPAFLEFACGPCPLGKIVIRLHDSICPRTCENFRGLCTGTEGLSTLQTPLCYKGTHLLRVIDNFIIQGGDVTRDDGSGGECIWAHQQGGHHNRYFPDENFILSHDRCGVVSMANEGPNTNQSQFFITCAPCPWLDGRHVAFGEVIHGFEVLSIIEGLDITPGQNPVIISDCGLVHFTP